MNREANRREIKCWEIDERDDQGKVRENGKKSTQSKEASYINRKDGK